MKYKSPDGCKIKQDLSTDLDFQQEVFSSNIDKTCVATQFRDLNSYFELLADFKYTKPQQTFVEII